MPKVCVIVLSITIVCIVGGCASLRQHVGSFGTSMSSPQFNVILITISTLRADHVGCLGYHRDTTPNMDRFARDNVLFTGAFASCGWMMPAHGSIFTSLYPKDHHVTHIKHSLQDEYYTLAEILYDNGFYCTGFCCNPRLDAEHGFGQGFDVYDDSSIAIMLQAMSAADPNPIDINKRRTNDLINDAAISFLANNTHEPFFMFVHYYDNHWDYLPPAPYNRLYDPQYKGDIDGTEIAREPLYSNPPTDKDIAHMIALYDGQVRQTDEDLGQLLDYLKRRGLLDNSLVIVLGDHGEEFYDHGHTSHHGVYEELIHIPMIISLPTRLRTARQVDSLVSQVDILPTILDYLKIPIPPQCSGKSLRPIIEGTVDTVNDFIFAEYTGGAVPDSYAARSNRLKCFQVTDGEPYAYDLLNDPHEQNKIMHDQFTENMRKLHTVLEEWMQKPAR